MAQSIINNGDSGASVRAALNGMFGNLYGGKSVPRRQIVANGGASMNDGGFGGAGTNNYTRGEARVSRRVGPQDATDIALLFTNFFGSQAAPGSTDGYNPITVEAAVEVASPSGYRPAVFAGGQVSAALAQGTFAYGESGLDVLANSQLFTRVGVIVASGQKWPRASLPVIGATDLAVESTSATSQIMATGNINLPSGGGYGGMYAPLAILGIPAVPHPAVIIDGDSIPFGVGDAANGDGDNNVGFLARGLKQTAFTIPYSKLAVPGMRIQWLVDQQAVSRRVLMQYGTHAIIGGPTNDIAGGQNLAACQTSLQKLWLQYKRRGLKVYQCYVFPRVTTTDNLATPGGQTPISGFTVGSTRDTLNASFDTALAAGQIDGIIDPCAGRYRLAGQAWSSPTGGAEDPANLSKWVTNGTANYASAEGVHPTQAIHTICAVPVNSLAATFTV